MSRFRRSELHWRREKTLVGQSDKPRSASPSLRGRSQLSNQQSAPSVAPDDDVFIPRSLSPGPATSSLPHGLSSQTSSSWHAGKLRQVQSGRLPSAGSSRPPSAGSSRPVQGDPSMRRPQSAAARKDAYQDAPQTDPGRISYPGGIPSEASPSGKRNAPARAQSATRRGAGAGIVPRSPGTAVAPGVSISPGVPGYGTLKSQLHEEVAIEETSVHDTSTRKTKVLARFVHLLHKVKRDVRVEIDNTAGIDAASLEKRMASTENILYRHELKEQTYERWSPLFTPVEDPREVAKQRYRRAGLKATSMLAMNSCKNDDEEILTPLSPRDTLRVDCPPQTRWLDHRESTMAAEGERRAMMKEVVSAEEVMRGAKEEGEKLQERMEQAEEDVEQAKFAGGSELAAAKKALMAVQEEAGRAAVRVEQASQVVRKARGKAADFRLKHSQLPADKKDVRGGSALKNPKPSLSVTLSAGEDDDVLDAKAAAEQAIEDAVADALQFGPPSAPAAIGLTLEEVARRLEERDSVLNVTHSKLLQADIPALVGCIRLHSGSLHSLLLAGNGFDDLCCVELVTGALWECTSLTRLDVSENVRIGHIGIAAIANLIDPNMRRKFQLANRQVEEASTPNIVQQKQKSQGRTKGLARTSSAQVAGADFPSEGAVRKPKRTSTVVVRRDKAFTPGGFPINSAPVDSPTWTSPTRSPSANVFMLAIVNCSGCRVGDRGAAALAHSLTQTTTLRVLKLEGVGIGELGSCTLASAMMENASLEELDLRSNTIGIRGAAAIGRALQMSVSLTSLDLAQNRLLDAGGALVAEALLENSTLRRLDLSSNQLADRTCLMLRATLCSTSFRQLEALLLNHNPFGHVGGGYLADVLLVNTQLRRMGLEGSSFRKADEKHGHAPLIDVYNPSGVYTLGLDLVAERQALVELIDLRDRLQQRRLAEGRPFKDCWKALELDGKVMETRKARDRCLERWGVDVPHSGNVVVEVKAEQQEPRQDLTIGNNVFKVLNNELRWQKGNDTWRLGLIRALMSRTMFTAPQMRSLLDTFAEDSCGCMVPCITMFPRCSEPEQLWQVTQELPEHEQTAVAKLLGPLSTFHPHNLTGQYDLDLGREWERCIAERLLTESLREGKWRTSISGLNWRNVRLNGMDIPAEEMLRLDEYVLPKSGRLQLDYVVADPVEHAKRITRKNNETILAHKAKFAVSMAVSTYAQSDTATFAGQISLGNNIYNWRQRAVHKIADTSEANRPRSHIAWPVEYAAFAKIIEKLRKILRGHDEQGDENEEWLLKLGEMSEPRELMISTSAKAKGRKSRLKGSRISPGKKSPSPTRGKRSPSPTRRKKSTSPLHTKRSPPVKRSKSPQSGSPPPRFAMTPALSTTPEDRGGSGVLNQEMQDDMYGLFQIQQELKARLSSSSKKHSADKNFAVHQFFRRTVVGIFITCRMLVEILKELEGSDDGQDPRNGNRVQAVVTFYQHISDRFRFSDVLRELSPDEQVAAQDRLGHMNTLDLRAPYGITYDLDIRMEEQRRVGFLLCKVVSTIRRPAGCLQQLKINNQPYSIKENSGTWLALTVAAASTASEGGGRVSFRFTCDLGDRKKGACSLIQMESVVRVNSEWAEYLQAREGVWGSINKIKKQWIALRIGDDARNMLRHELFVVKWSVDHSVFAQRSHVGLQSFLRSEKGYNIACMGMLELIKIRISRLLAIKHGEDAKALSMHLRENEEVELVKRMRVHFPVLWHAFTFYCTHIHFVGENLDEEAIEFDVKRIHIEGFKQMFRDCRLEEKGIHNGDGTTAFMKSRQPDMGGKPEGYTLMHYEFLEAIVRLVLVKAQRDGSTHSELLAQSLDNLVRNSLEPNMAAGAQMVPNQFRMKFLYKGNIDEVFRVYHKFLNAAFVTSNYSSKEIETGKSRKFTSNSELALKFNRLKRRSSVSTTKQQWVKSAMVLQPAVPGRMDLEQWFNFLSTAGLLRPHGPVTLRYARLLFLWSSFGGSFDVPYHEKTSKGNFMLDFVDFLEALARLAQLLVLPSERQLLLYFKENGAVCDLKEDPVDESPEEPLDTKLAILLEIIIREFKEQMGADDVPHLCGILEMRRRDQRNGESQAPKLKFTRLATVGRGFR
ncbi:hypothetical protein CYMTET_6392 [Cymbomonas tetramitiformis]|uniref:Uncharacterized protein n=1 Tax=Cymbomonas tetramitiformis TaxID=36881 RepID=A0AAE0GX76_9CHLO|nr:hypothetical protein CYMTET_6392 [Cymbomonas tetramitiformis]